MYSEPKYPPKSVSRFTISRKLISESRFEKSCERVVSLTISSCFFEDGGLGFLKAFPALKILAIYEPKNLLGIQGISQVHMLNDLTIEDSDLATLDGLEFCSNIKVLRLHKLGVSDLSVLEGMGIEKLDISYSPINDLPNELPFLWDLGVSDCQKLRRIPYYPSVTSLLCESLKIRSLRQYSGSQLTHFEISETRLRRIPDLPHAKSIVASKSRITSLLPYDPNFQSKVRVLDVRRNKLTSLDGLENYPDLKDFDAMDNKICDISSLSKRLPSDIIIRLRLSRNRITKIPLLRMDLASLRTYGHCRMEWSFSNNLIEDIRPLVPIFGKEQEEDDDRQLLLDNNPLSLRSLLILSENKKMGAYFQISEKDMKRIKRYREERTFEDD